MKNILCKGSANNINEFVKLLEKEGIKIENQCVSEDSAESICSYFLEDPSITLEYEYLFDKKLNKMKLRGWKVLKDFDVYTVKGGNFLADQKTIPITKDKIAVPVEVLKSQGFIIEDYEVEYKIGAWLYNEEAKIIFKYDGLNSNGNYKCSEGLIGSSFYGKHPNFSPYYDKHRLATDKEIENYYIALADYKGYRKGVTFKDAKNLSRKETIDRNLTYCFSENSIYCDKCYIYYNGVWGEIVEEDIKIGEYYVVFDKKGSFITINDVKYYLNDLVALYEFLKKYNNQIKYLAVGCKAQYKVDLEILKEIIDKF